MEFSHPTTCKCRQCNELNRQLSETKDALTREQAKTSNIIGERDKLVDTQIQLTETLIERNEQLEALRNERQEMFKDLVDREFMLDVLDIDCGITKVQLEAAQWKNDLMGKVIMGMAQERSVLIEKIGQPTKEVVTEYKTAAFGTADIIILPLAIIGVVFFFSFLCTSK